MPCSRSKHLLAIKSHAGLHALFWLVTIAVVLGISQPALSQEQSSCISCHREDIDDEQTKLVKDFIGGVHFKRGISCIDCHGGDADAEEMDDAMDPDAGFMEAPSRHEIPKFCARCHADPSFMRGYNPNISTDQYSKYLISGHGRRLSKSRDSKVAVCTSCHGVHGIMKSDDPASKTYALNIPFTCAKCHSDTAYMAGRDIPTNQFHEYEASVHGQALLKKGDRSAPSCTACHGSHEARRPDPKGVANVCAQCHNYNRELFVASPHKAAHEKHNYPECEVCHGSHAIGKTSDDMLHSESEGVCKNCHDDGSEGLIVAITMKAAIDSLKMSIDTAEAVVGMVRRYGMDTEEPEYGLRQAKNKLVQSRALIHAFSSDKVTSATNEGEKLALTAHVQGHNLLEQYNFRRRGFTLSVIIIFFLSILLTIKIRSLPGEHEVS